MSGRVIIPSIVRQIREAGLPVEQMLKEIESTGQGKLVDDVLSRLLSSTKEVHGSRAADELRNPGWTGVAPIENLRRLAMVQSPERLNNMKFVNKKQYNMAFIKDGSWYMPSQDAIHLEPSRMISGPSVFTHEGHHQALENKVVPRTIEQVNKFTNRVMFYPEEGAKKLASPAGTTDDWSRLYGGHARDIAEEGEAMMTELVNLKTIGAGVQSGRLRQLESYLDARPELKGKLLKRLSALLSVPVAAGVGMPRTGEENA